jgi:hypothetical protein
MPYITQEQRTSIECSQDPLNIGEFNYFLTMIIIDYLENPESGRLCYDKYNAVMGALECIKQEFYRREIAPYEDIKIKENGDVY